MRNAIIIFIIIALGVIAYSNSLGGDFIWDDVAFVIYNDFIKNPHLFTQYFTSKDALAKGTLNDENYRPFLTLSYAIDYSWWKLNPLGYHLTNLFFHILNAILVFYLALLILRKKIAASLAALFFLTHPIQTEAVTWISGRADVLFLFFYLAGFIAYIKRNSFRLPFLYFFSFLLFCFSLLSKEMAATFPLMIILYDLFYEKKERIGKRAIRYLPFFAILEIYVIARFNIIQKFAQCDYWTGSAYTTMLSMARGIFQYIKLLVYPVGLCGDYLAFPIANSIKEPATFLSAIFIILLIAIAVRLSKKQKTASFCIFWFFITLAPASNIIPIQILIAERFLYLPSIGYCILIAFLFSSGFKIEQKRFLGILSLCASIALVGFYSYRTMQRNLVWSNGVTFFEDIAKKYPENYRAHLNLAVEYYNQGKIDKTFAKAKESLKTAPAPGTQSARRMMALYYISKDRLDEAKDEYMKILEIDPQSISAYKALGIVYERQKKFDEALRAYKKALALEPESLDLKISLATLHILRGDIEKGIKELEVVLKDEPPYHYRSTYAAACLRLGELYSIKKQPEKAHKIWRRVYDDFKDQIWFNEISGMLIEKESLDEILAKTEFWQPEFKVVFYYYAGIKKELDGNVKAAKIYYEKSEETTTSKLQSVKALALKRLGELNRTKNTP